MKNKATLNEDYEKVIKPELKDTIDIVAMCAHDLRHTGLMEVSMQPEHTISGSEVVFVFKGIERPASDTVINGQSGTLIVDDYEYVKMIELTKECGPDGCTI